MNLVPRQQTKPSKLEWLQAVSVAWTSLFGVRPYNAQLGVLYGMFGEETGYGASCWNNNVGNIRAFPGFEGDIIDLPGAWEILKQPDGSEKRVVTGGAFRAYATLTEGYIALLSFLKTNEPDAFVELQRPMPDGRVFVYGLKTDRYFSGPVTIYANGVWDIASRFVRNFSNELHQVLTADTVPSLPAIPVPIAADGAPTSPESPASKSSKPPAS